MIKQQKINLKDLKEEAEKNDCMVRNAIYDRRCYITWTNHFPPDYYAHIKDVHFTNTGVLCKGKWFWWSTYAKDTLAEYGNDEVDEMADEIEVLAWQPLPEPYEGESDGE